MAVLSFIPSCTNTSVRRCFSAYAILSSHIGSVCRCSTLLHHVICLFTGHATPSCPISLGPLASGSRFRPSPCGVQFLFFALGPCVLLHSWVVIRSAQDKQIDYNKCVDEHERYCILISIASLFIVPCIQASKYALLINVRTEDTRFTSRPFTLASSRTPPKPVGSALAVHPTADH